MRQRIKEIAATRVRYGYRRIHVLLRREGWMVNHKRVRPHTGLAGATPAEVAARSAPQRGVGHAPHPVAITACIGQNSTTGLYF